MMASRLNHREHVIPALTDHLEDDGGVIGPSIVRTRAEHRQSTFRVALLKVCACLWTSPVNYIDETHKLWARQRAGIGRVRAKGSHRTRPSLATIWQTRMRSRAKQQWCEESRLA